MINNLWIDIETTGLDYNNDTIIELACIYNYTEFHEYCLPAKKPEIWEEISELTGLTWEFLEQNGVSEEILYHKFLKFLDSKIDKYNKTEKLIFSGYKADFDKEFIRKLFIKNNNNFLGSYFLNINLDIMSIIAHYITQKQITEIFENYKLKTVCDFFKINFKAHSALEDIKATKKIYEIMVKNENNNKKISIKR